MFVVGVIGLLLVASMVVDFHYYSNLYDAKTPEEIQKICQSDWYQNDKVKDLPAKCSTIKLYN